MLPPITHWTLNCRHRIPAYDVDLSMGDMVRCPTCNGISEIDRPVRAHSYNQSIKMAKDSPLKRFTKNK